MNEKMCLICRDTKKYSMGKGGLIYFNFHNKRFLLRLHLILYKEYPNSVYNKIMTNISPLTISERLFEKFCICNLIPYTKIPENPDIPTPDYKIEIDGCVIYVEVKQLDNNNEDKSNISPFIKNKNQPFVLSTTDKRLRHKIDDARRQFQNYKNENNLLVIYDNTTVGFIDPIEVKMAMYGDETVELKFQIGENRPNLISSKDRFGGNRKMTSKRNTSISAVSILRKLRNDNLFLSVYHNFFAKYPIDTSLLQNNHVEHFIINKKISDEFQEWSKI